MKTIPREYHADRIEDWTALALALWKREIATERAEIMAAAISDPEVGKADALQLGFMIGAAIALAKVANGELLVVEKE